MEDDSTATTVVVVIVVIVVLLAIAALLFWYFGGSFDQTVVYRFTDTGTSTYVGENFTAYTSNATTTGVTLTVTAPVDPIGKQFIIDNSAGTGTVTISGPTVGGQTITTTTTPPVSYAPSKVRPKAVGLFVWNTSSTLLRVS